MRNIILEKSYTKYGEETSPRPFSGKLKLSISLDHYCKVLSSLFLLYIKLRAIEIYWNQAADDLLLAHIKHFQKIKRGLELVSLHHFLHIIFEEKSFTCYILLIDQVSLCNCFYFVRYWSICVLQLFVDQGVTSWILKLSF